jgi:hypothetical protein
VSYLRGRRLYDRVNCGVCGLPTRLIELHTEGVRSLHFMKDEQGQLRHWSCWSTTPTRGHEGEQAKPPPSQTAGRGETVTNPERTVVEERRQLACDQRDVGIGPWLADADSRAASAGGSAGAEVETPLPSGGSPGSVGGRAPVGFGRLDHRAGVPADGGTPVHTSAGADVLHPQPSVSAGIQCGGFA